MLLMLRHVCFLVSTMTGIEPDGLKMDAELAFPRQIKEVLKDLRVGCSDVIDGHEQGRGPRNLLIILYFDEASSVLVSEIRFGRMPIPR